MSEWDYKILGSVAKVKGRIGWKGYKTSDLRDFGPIVFSGTEIKSQTFIDFSKVKHLTAEKYEESPEIMLKDKDIMVATRGSLGQIGFYRKEYGPATINPSLVIVGDFEGIPEFLFYYFISSLGQENILAQASGTTIPAIYQADLKKIKIPYPPVAIQTAITEILSSLDDKIELNNKINQELENLAQTLFKQWFIDFEFPNENGEPYKSSGGEMVESELGEIPKGWTTQILSEATKLIRGISYRKPELVLKGEGIAFVNLKCFSLNGTFRQDGIKYYNGKYKNEQILCNNDILVAVTDLTQDREIIGMPILWDGSTNALPSLDTCIIRSETSELKNFLYYEFKTKRYKSRIIEHANGSTVLHLSVKGLETYVFPLPNDEILKNWGETIQPILETINSNINEIYELSKTRDYLLPKLISGELEINELPN